MWRKIHTDMSLQDVLAVMPPPRSLGHAGTQYLEFENGDITVQLDLQERVMRVAVRPPTGPGTPNWLIGVALALLATYTGYLWWRNRPVPAGLCPVCEYDLRGNISGRCPECGTVVRDFFELVVAQAILEDLVGVDHFSVDGTLIQSFASIKSLRPADTQDRKVADGADDDDPCNSTVNFRGEKRSNETHRSIVDPEARLARKGPGKPALLSHSGHVLMENRNGLCLDVSIDEANGTAERVQSGVMLDRVYDRHDLHPRTLGADAGYKNGKYLHVLEQFGIVPHVPVSDLRIRGDGHGAEARRRARRRRQSVGYVLSQRVRKRTEEMIGWFKTIGGLARARFIGRWKITQQADLTAAAYNVLRIAKLVPTA